MSALMPFRQVTRDDNEEMMRQQIQTLTTQTPYNSLDFFYLLNRILRVSDILQNNFYNKPEKIFCFMKNN